jgi:hypothetical protein
MFTRVNTSKKDAKFTPFSAKISIMALNGIQLRAFICRIPVGTHYAMGEEGNYNRWG